MTEIRYCLHGEIDLATAPQLRADLRRALEADGACLLVDCSRLTFIDSRGVGVLLEANAMLEAEGRHMLILNCHGGPRRVFEALRLTDLFRYERESAVGKTMRGGVSSGSLSWI